MKNLLKGLQYWSDLLDFNLMVLTPKILILIYFLSGATALIYEILWEKKLELILGTSALAVTLILSAFFIGLALGSLIFARLADSLNTKLAFLIYGVIEILIGVLAILSTRILLFGNPEILALLFLILPTTLIGGTFPILTRLYCQVSEIKNGISLVYFANTLGGVVGLSLATFFLIRILGVDGLIQAAALLNITVGLINFKLGILGKSDSFQVSHAVKTENRRDDKKRLVLLTSLFLMGLLSLSLEVLWTKALSLVTGANFYSFSLILAIYLLGIALGSLAARMLDKNKASFWLGVVLALMGIWVLFSLNFFNFLPTFYHQLVSFYPQFYWSLTVMIAIYLFVIFPFTFLSGIAFPLAAQILNLTKVGKTAGQAYFINTLGGVLGPVVIYFLALDYLGIQKSIILISICYGAVALLFIKRRWGRFLVLAAILALSLSNLWVFGWDKVELTSGKYIYPAGDPESKLLFYREGKQSIVTVDKTLGDISLDINGKTDASAMGDLETELLLGHIPMILAQNPDKVLVIGFGAGITAGAVSSYPVNKIDIVEIEPAVLEAAPFFAKNNHDVLNNPAVHLIVNDARNYLLKTNQKYDVIVSEPSNLWISGTANLFSKQFYQVVLEHLLENGVMFQWIHTYRMSQEDLKIAIRTFQTVFPNTSLWAISSGGDIFLLGSKAPLRVDLNDFNLSDQTKNDLKRLGIENPSSQIFDYFVSQGEDLKSKIGEGKIHTDTFPLLEIDSPIDFYVSSDLDNIRFISQLSQIYSKNKQSATVRRLLFAVTDPTKTDNKQLEEEFNQLISLRPENHRFKKLYASFLAKKAQQAIDQEEYISAEEDVKKALEFSPDYYYVYNVQGHLYSQEGKLDQAIDSYKKSIELTSDYSGSYVLLALVYDLKKDYQSAEWELLKALQLNPKNTTALNSLGRLYLKMGKAAQAKETFLKSLGVDFNQPEIRVGVQLLDRSQK